MTKGAPGDGEMGSSDLSHTYKKHTLQKSFDTFSEENGDFYIKMKVFPSLRCSLTDRLKRLSDIIPVQTLVR